MYLLSDGKNYAMKNPFNENDWLLTTSPVKATRLSYKQARSLVNRKGKRFNQFRDMSLVDAGDGEEQDANLKAKSNANVYIGKNDVELDESILDQVIKEASQVIGLAAFGNAELIQYKEQLEIALSKYDSAESDVLHSLEKYKIDHNGKNPQAHKMAKIAYLLDEIRDKHKKIKQCLRYVEVMQDAITHKYNLHKLKYELKKVEYEKYKGRTEYYDIALNILE